MQHPGPVHTRHMTVPCHQAVPHSPVTSPPNPLSSLSVAPAVHRCWAIHCCPCRCPHHPCRCPPPRRLVLAVLILSLSSSSSSLSLFSSTLSPSPSSSATHKRPCPCLVGILSFGPSSPVSLFLLSGRCPLPLPALIAIFFLVRLLTVVVEGCCLWCGGIVVVNWPFYCGPPFLQVEARGGSCCCCCGGIIGVNLFLGCRIVVMQLDPLY
jgi:hypothetical protein